MNVSYFCVLEEELLDMSDLEHSANDDHRESGGKCKKKKRRRREIDMVCLYVTSIDLDININQL